MIKELIHICPDEKFIDCAISQFELFDNIKSVFFILQKKRKTLFLKKSAANIFFFDSSRKLLKSLRKEHPNSTVVLHSICIDPYYIKKLNNRLILCFWGWELYSDIYSPLKRFIQIDLYKPITREMLEKNKRLTIKIKELIKKALGINYWRERNYKDLLEKCEAFSTVYPIEFSMLNYNKKKFFPFRYIRPIANNSIFKPKVIQSEHPRVLVGNSLASTNNHFDILKKLNDYGIYIEVVLPISYGGDIHYKRILKEYTSGLKFIKPIYVEKFLDRSEYFNLIDSCNALIFGHLRQQGAGNINQGLRDGFDIYLYEESINYKHFVEKGFIIHTIENDLLNIFLGKGLSLQEQQQNYRNSLIGHNFEEYRKNIIDFFKTF